MVSTVDGKASGVAVNGERPPQQIELRGEPTEPNIVGPLPLTGIRLRLYSFTGNKS
jgi:hypothetical protein